MFDWDAEAMREFHERGRPAATDGEGDREYADNVGRANPDRAWILSDRDVWYANPAYHGPRVPHPEEEADDAWRESQGDVRDDFPLALEYPEEDRALPAFEDDGPF